jgi:Skp family chaperone for outer membrane proteins
VALRRDFEQYPASHQARLDARKVALFDESRALKRKRAELPAAEYWAQHQALESKFNALQKDYLSLEQELRSRRGQLRADVLAAARPRLEQLAKAESVTLIVDQSATIWTDDNVDLTHRFLSME